MEWIKGAYERGNPIYKRLKDMGLEKCEDIWMYGTLKHRFGYYPPEDKVVKVDKWVSVYQVQGTPMVDFTKDHAFYPRWWMPILPPKPPKPPKE